MDYKSNIECEKKPLEGSSFGDELQMWGKLVLLPFHSDLERETWSQLKIPNEFFVQSYIYIHKFIFLSCAPQSCELCVKENPLFLHICQNKSISPISSGGKHDPIIILNILVRNVVLFGSDLCWLFYLCLFNVSYQVTTLRISKLYDDQSSPDYFVWKNKVSICMIWESNLAIRQF